MRKAVALTLGLMAFFAAKTAFCMTIETHETERYFFEDGKVTKADGEFDNTYFLDPEKNTLTRIRVYNYRRKKITPDQTVYYIQRNLNSHPTNASRFGLVPVVRAIGKPDPDTVETVVIEDQYVDTATSVANRLIFARAKRLK